MDPLLAVFLASLPANLAVYCLGFWRGRRRSRLRRCLSCVNGWKRLD